MHDLKQRANEFDGDLIELIDDLGLGSKDGVDTYLTEEELEILVGEMKKSELA